MNEPDNLVTRSQALAKRISELLAGQGPDVQGAALADLVAMFFAGHHPDIRDEVMRTWISFMQKLIEPNDHILMPGGWPKGGTVQ
jgi:hypothetical protein